MQIGIDLGASKIESVVLSDDGKEHLREREYATKLQWDNKPYKKNSNRDWKKI